MPKPSFQKLWLNYPAVAAPCDGPYENQCAIRMSLALNGEGSIKIDKAHYTEPLCKHGHARGAESLANWLSTKIGRPQKWMGSADGKAGIQHKLGIVFFKDCFTRAGSELQLGDHIDLWFLTTARTYSDPDNKAKQLWFWHLA